MGYLRAREDARAFYPSWLGLSHNCRARFIPELAQGIDSTRFQEFENQFQITAVCGLDAKSRWNKMSGAVSHPHHVKGGKNGIQPNHTHSHTGAAWPRGFGDGERPSGG